MTKIDNESLEVQTQEVSRGTKTSKMSKAKQHNMIAKTSKRGRLSKEATDKSVT